MFPSQNVGLGNFPSQNVGLGKFPSQYVGLTQLPPSNGLDIYKILLLNVGLGIVQCASSPHV